MSHPDISHDPHGIDRLIYVVMALKSSVLSTILHPKCLPGIEKRPDLLYLSDTTKISARFPHARQY